MSKKYYEYYEDVYAAVRTAGAESYNSPPGQGFAELFELSFLPPAGKVLDLGCGEGFYSVLFAAAGYEVLGVDISVSAVRLARVRARKQNLTRVHFRVADGTHLDGLADQSFHVVLSMHCYHCLSAAPDRQAHLREAWRVLQPGGIFVFENMAAPLREDLPAFRAWHVERNTEVMETEAGVTTTAGATPSFYHTDRSSGKKVEVPTAVAMAHRFYGRLEHVVAQLENVGFEILLARTTVPDRARLKRPELVHGDNLIYALKPEEAFHQENGNKKDTTLGK